MGDGTVHNVLFAATENDSVYAFDADNNTGANANPLWKVSLLKSGENPILDGPIQPVEGVSSTPVIDLTTNTMYVVSAQATAAGGTFRLNALDIRTGNQKSGSPVQITAHVQGTNATTLTTACLQRDAVRCQSRRHLSHPLASALTGLGHFFAWEEPLSSGNGAGL